jgi:hypothetical protein
MTDESAPNTVENSGKKRNNGRPFAPGFDERRWLKGRPRVPKDIKALAENLLWEIASEEIENPKTGEKVDRLRALLRSMTTSKQSADKKEFLARLLGAVPQTIQGPGENGELITKVVFVDDTSDNKTPDPTPDTGGGE